MWPAIVAAVAGRCRSNFSSKIRGVSAITKTKLPANEQRSVELDALRLTLDRLRDTILTIVTGLSDAQLNSAALPSERTPLELLKHLTLGDERYWFSSILGGGDLDWIPQGPPSVSSCIT